MQPMAGLVEEKAVGLIGPGVPAKALLFIDEHPWPRQMHGRRDPRQPTSQNYDRSHHLQIAQMLPDFAHKTLEIWRVGTCKTRVCPLVCGADASSCDQLRRAK